MRGESDDAEPVPEAAEDQAPSGTPRDGEFDEPDTGEAESRSREEYADAMRESDPLAGGIEQPGVPEAEVTSTADPLGEPMAQDDPPERQDDTGSAAGADNAEPGSDGNGLTADPGDILAEPLPGDSTVGEQPATLGQDLEATEHGGRGSGEEAGDTSLLPDLPPGQATAAAEHDQAAPGPEEDQDKRTGPERVYADGHEYELTGNPRDGLWISGLPGEAPGTPEGDPYGAARVGDKLSGPEESKNRRDRFVDAVSEHLEDINANLDHLDKGLEDLYRDRPRPTHSVSVHDHVPFVVPGTATEHGPADAAHMLSAALVLAALSVKLQKFINERRHAEI